MKNFWKTIEKPLLALAPMAGVTDSAFRQICRENGADVVYSEMASATALFFNPKKTLELLEFNKSERPFVVQLFGKVPEHFAKAAQILSDPANFSPFVKGRCPKGRGILKIPLSPPFTKGEDLIPDGIDINFGCPAKKVFGHGSGCALMPQKKLAREIIKAVCDNTKLPVSLKIRAGIGPVKYPLKRGVRQDEQFNGVNSTDALEFIKNVKDLPFSAVMVHGRTYEGKFTGKVDFEIVAEIKKIIPNKIVMANGGIDTPEKALEVLQNWSEIDGIGIARGALGRPFIFNEIKYKLSPLPEGRCPKRTERWEQIEKIAIRHAQLLYKTKGKRGMFEIRKHLAWYVKGFPGAGKLRRKLVLVKSVKEIKEILG
ncbi:MAG: tRNA-dihydrouridine synthase [Candidatus Moranbacteria bacterium]|nr:tRNA-dihydrouridine synthase [Candidatus Moranbacteria bacterium]